MVERKRMEQGGLYIDNPEHWEMFETTIYHYVQRGNGNVNIPSDICHHLKLKHKDKIMVAIKRRKNR